MAKPFMTYSQQIAKLRDEKELLIEDEAYAESMLRQNSYFALITGYKHLFKDKSSGKYIRGVKFEDIVALYRFDEGLRELFLKYLCQVERHIRSLVSYYFCETYGESQIEYLNVNNYRYNGQNIDRVNRLIGYLSQIVSDVNSQYEYIKHYVRKNHNVPLWVLLNAVTFGSLSKMYTLLKQNVQIKISSGFASVNESQLGKILNILTKYRNVCAHNERLFSHRERDSIPDMLLHQKMGIPKKGTEYIYGKSDLFSVVISLRYLLPKEDFFIFKNRLAFLIDIFCKESSAITEPELLKAMGFPKNWKTITAFRKI